ncbi:ADP-ribosylglycohydrolase family protein [Coralliovum pocilloporae]|uniref:ADP-ribosylglycohydrolase family protein n=1 Tax=Coralliovum pocilloporae TaxID=3066369 RepID=UPI003306E597
MSTPSDLHTEQQPEKQDKKRTRQQAALLGLFVADAAALGLHWLYDPERLDALQEAHRSLAFRPVTDEAYKDAKGIFVHHQRHTGTLSQYGETARLALEVWGRQEQENAPSAFQAEYVRHFGPGGTYNGYIDRPTRATLDAVAAAGDTPSLLSGADDDQLPAVITTAATTLALGAADATTLETMTRITNNNDFATGAAQILGNWLHNTIETGDSTFSESFLTSEKSELSNRLADAASSGQTVSEAAEHYGRACNLIQGFPLALTILRNTQSYREAIEANIHAGGDSCGRSMIIGPIAGARWGLGGENGIPLDWILQLSDARDIWNNIQTLTRQASK